MQLLVNSVIKNIQEKAVVNFPPPALWELDNLQITSACTLRGWLKHFKILFRNACFVYISPRRLTTPLRSFLHQNFCLTWLAGGPFCSERLAMYTWLRKILLLLYRKVLVGMVDRKNILFRKTCYVCIYGSENPHSDLCNVLFTA